MSTGIQGSLLGGSLGNGSGSNLGTGLRGGLGSESWSLYEEFDSLKKKSLFQ